jgi:hypothetical protein
MITNKKERLSGIGKDENRIAFVLSAEKLKEAIESIKVHKFMKTLKLKILFSFIIGSTLLVIPNLALSDGMIIRPDPYSDRWDYLNESNQQAFINYEDGLVKMILSIGMEEVSGNAVWIFPVPAEPNKVVIDIVTKMPRLSGEEITKKAKSNLFDIKKVLPATQIYTIPFIVWWGIMVTYEEPVGGLSVAFPLGMGRVIETDVITYEHLEKEGVTTEIITAKTAQALYQYLQNKNLKVEEGSIPVLDYYIGKEFTFVVSWISETTAVTPTLKQRGVFVTFPTQKIYYPLLLTSVYGSKVVPATIRIIGHRSPKIFKDIKNYTETKYFINGNVTIEEELKGFYKGPIKNVKYTKVEIKAPSKFLTDDLWISPRAPLKTYYSSFVAQHPFFSGIFLLILSSIITGIIAGGIVFRDLRNKNSIFKLALIGLSNCLSIMGLLITTFIVGTKARDENIVSLLNKLKQKGYVWKRRLAVILFFAASPFLGCGILGILIIPHFIELISDIGDINNIPPILIISIIYIIPFLVLAFSLFIKRIKPEDKSLFIQLKSAGYSSWSFNPKDKMKFIFVPLFSVSFLAISWLIIKLVELTV